MQLKHESFDVVGKRQQATQAEDDDKGHFTYKILMTPGLPMGKGDARPLLR